VERIDWMYPEFSDAVRDTLRNISNLQIRTRIANSLYYRDILTVKDILNLPPGAFQRLKNIGGKCTIEFNKSLFEVVQIQLHTQRSWEMLQHNGPYRIRWVLYEHYIDSNDAWMFDDEDLTKPICSWIPDDEVGRDDWWDRVNARRADWDL